MVDLDSDFGHEDRHPKQSSDISWIELFLDLVFIAALIQAGDRLVANLGITGLAEFTLFFTLLWWAWSGITIHFARRETDDVTARLIVFLFLFAVAMLGVLAGRGTLAHTATFALLYALARGSIAALYADLAWRDAKGRPVALRFAGGFAAGALLWALSALLPEPWRFGIWALAVATELGTGLLQDKKALRDTLSLDAGRLSERYGQLTLIVLGESFIKMVSGLVAGPGLTAQTAALSLLALVFTGAVFWAYYGDIAGSTIRKGRARLWTYLHLPLTMSVAALGVSFDPIMGQEPGMVIEAANQRLLHVAGIAVFFWLAMIDLFARTSDAAGGYRTALARLASVLLLGISWAVGSGATVLLAVAIAAGACALPVIVESLRRPHAGASTRAEVKQEKRPSGELSI